MKGKSLSRVRLLATPWTAAYQAPLSMGFSRQEYWSGVPTSHQFNYFTYMLQIYILLFFFSEVITVCDTSPLLILLMATLHFLKFLTEFLKISYRNWRALRKCDQKLGNATLDNIISRSFELMVVSGENGKATNYPLEHGKFYAFSWNSPFQNVQCTSS